MRILKITIGLVIFILFGVQIGLPQEKSFTYDDYLNSGCVIQQSAKDHRWYFHGWIDHNERPREIRLISVPDSADKAMDDCKAFLKNVDKELKKRRDRNVRSDDHSGQVPSPNPA